jgi:hypothetical protein
VPCLSIFAYPLSFSYYYQALITFVKSNIHSFILHSNTYPKQSIHLFLQLSPTLSLEYHFTFWPPNHFIFGNTEPNQTQDSFD